MHDNDEKKSREYELMRISTRNIDSEDLVDTFPTIFQYKLLQRHPS